MLQPHPETPAVATSAQPAAERQSVLDLPLAELQASAPLRWLLRGCVDFHRCPYIGIFYGSCFFLMGHALWQVFNHAPAYVLAVSAGFLLLGPFLCLGLYAASRDLEQGRAPRLTSSLLAWRPSLASMAIFAAVLLILEMLWGRASLVVFAVTMKTLPAGGNIAALVLESGNLEFIFAYTAVATFFGGLIFLSSAISIPMILDRETDAISAALTSFRACLQNPGVMLLWAALVAGLTVIAIVPGFLGILVIGPVLGHASWHAYREITSPAAAEAQNSAR